MEENLRHLANPAGPPVASSSATAAGIAWAAQAFRRAGVDDVHTEKFAVPVGRGNKTTGEFENIIAEIRGRELPDQLVILAGHLDPSAKASGAMRDGDTAAMVIDAARAIHACGSIPRRSIRFVLFTGPPQAMLGSKAYVAAHRAELDHVIAAISLDRAVGRVTGFSLGGRTEMLAAAREALAPIRSVGADWFTTDAKISADSFDFLLEGIPTLVPNEEREKSRSGRQPSQGTYDKMAIDALKHQVAVVAVAAYALADTEERVGSRQSRNEVQRLLEETGIAEKMKTEGIWEAWEKHERGRQP